MQPIFQRFLYIWFGRSRRDKRHIETAEKVQRFFCETVADHPGRVYNTDGAVLEGKALHPAAITATNAQAALASGEPLSGNALRCVREFWNTPMRRDVRRYYGNCLYMFAVLELGGNDRIY